MTLHITRISRRYTLQVSDRLVSGGIQDPIANKNLIYWARGAVVTIGYTGLAYGLSRFNRNVPTDEWIAEILWGKPIPRGRDSIRPATGGFERIGRWLDIGQSAELLRSELQSSIERLQPKHRTFPFQLIMAGWQEIRHKRFKPTFIEITKRWGNSRFVIERPQRNWYEGGQIGLITNPDGYIPEIELADLAKNLPIASPDETENLLVNSIRRVATKNPEKVGPHCMSILLPPIGMASIRVRFLPTITHKGILVSENQKKGPELPIAFTPWILGPNMYHSPSIQIGTSHLYMEPLEIIMEAPNAENGIVGYIGSLDRPSGP